MFVIIEAHRGSFPVARILSYLAGIRAVSLKEPSQEVQPKSGIYTRFMGYVIQSRRMDTLLFILHERLGVAGRAGELGVGNDENQVRVGKLLGVVQSESEHRTRRNMRKNSDLHVKLSLRPNRKQEQKSELVTNHTFTRNRCNFFFLMALRPKGTKTQISPNSHVRGAQMIFSAFFYDAR